MSHKAQIFSNNKVMPNVLTLQISTQWTSPSQSYKAPKWQIWKCEPGWFLLGQSHIRYIKFLCVFHLSTDKSKQTYKGLVSSLHKHHDVLLPCIANHLVTNSSTHGYNVND